MLVLGAVAYDPKVVTIWEGFRAWFSGRGFDFDFVLFSNYERQAEAHLAGHVDVAWNSPLAWVRTRRLAAAAGRTARALAMRDTDQDLRSVVLVRADGVADRAVAVDGVDGLAGREDGVADRAVAVDGVDSLAGREVAVGAVDSPQATLLPLSHLAGLGLEPGRDFRVRRFDVGVGKHGDHVGGERDAARALVAGAVDAACVIDANHLAFFADGTLPAGSVRVCSETERYDHCNFTVFGDDPRFDRFLELLLGMAYDDAQVRPLLDLEGLRQWRPGRTSGYALLETAVDRLGFYDAGGRITATDYHP